MEQEEDQRQFFKDLGATAEQTVEDVRGVEEDYFAVLQNMLIAFPWIAESPPECKVMPIKTL